MVSRVGRDPIPADRSGPGCTVTGGAAFHTVRVSSDRGERPPAGWTPPTTVSSTVVYRNNWMTVREDRLRLTDGSETIYGVVDKSDYAIVVAEQDGGFHLVEQFRYAIGRRSWEFPMGTWPAGSAGASTGTPLELAQAELVEETGLTAERWRPLGTLHGALGFCSQSFSVFHATELHAGAHRREESEADMVHRLVGEDEFRAMIRAGEIVDGSTIAAYGLLRLELHR